MPVLRIIVRASGVVIFQKYYGPLLAWDNYEDAEYFDSWVRY